MDPYATLGIDRGADKSQIKKAYRARAKKAHPDAGGSVEKFGELQKCYDVLMDDARRSHYDKTGEFKGREPDNAQAHLFEMVSTLLDMVMQDIAQTGQIEHVASIDLLGRMVRKAHDFVTKSHQFQAQLEKQLQINIKLAKRFKLKKTTADPNLMEMIVAGRVTAIRQAIVAENAKLDKMKEAIAFLDDYRFEVDPTPQSAYQDAASLLRQMIGGSGYRVY